MTSEPNKIAIFDVKKELSFMTADRELMYWHSNKEWYILNHDTHRYELTEKAPQRAIESFEKWYEQWEDGKKAK